VEALVKRMMNVWVAAQLAASQHGAYVKGVNLLIERTRKFSCFEIPTRCQLAILVKRPYREGSPLGSEESRALGNESCNYLKKLV
jgi:hypothetical protein